MRRIALTVVSVLALTAPALAAGSGSTTPPAAPATPAPASTAAPAQPGAAVFGDVGKLVDASTIPALQNIIVAGTQIHYLGDEYGLKAYFVTNAGQGQVLYITPDGQASIVGAMFGGDGTPVSVMQLARLRQAGFDPVPFLNKNSAPSPVAAASSSAASTPTATASTPAVSPGEQLLAESSRASWLAFGANTGRMLTVFMDPNCDHCHVMFKQLQPYVAANKIYLRVIPVNIVSDSSRGDIINIMSSTDPQAAWTAKINGQPVPPPAQVNPQAEAAAAANTTIFTRWQLPVTPYSVYRNSAGEVKVLAGEPTDMSSFLTELGVAQ